jgi:hypothetical protein
MTTAEIIAELKHRDPDGTCPVIVFDGDKMLTVTRVSEDRLVPATSPFYKRVGSRAEVAVPVIILD